jgi:predicted Zn-dependent protease
MKKIFFFIVLSAWLMNCTKNLVTGRKQLNLVSETELQSMAKQEYQTFLTQNSVVSVSSNRDAEMVRRVGTRIANAIKSYYNAQGQTALLNGYEWEFNLIDNKEANAWCMPGGKVVVYTGILPITQNEATHAVAQHGSERMSQGLLQQLGGTVLQVALANKPTQTQNLFNTAYGIGSTVGGTLPFSRKSETEADKYGLYFAAMAGYNPQEAIPFWERMAATSGAKPPEFLSSHPSDARRIDNIRANMPAALKFYKPLKK